MIRTTYKPCLQTTYSFCALDRSALLGSLLRMVIIARGVGDRSSTRICSGSGGPKSFCPSLEKRMKWSEFQGNVEAGDLALVVDDSTPKCSWPSWRLLEIYPNKDDETVRVAQVKTKSGTFYRPITKLCV